MCQRHARNEYRKYKRLSCVSIIQRQGCVFVNEYRKYELLAYVSIIQHEGCMSADEYRMSARVPHVRAVHMCPLLAARGSKHEST